MSDNQTLIWADLNPQQQPHKNNQNYMSKDGAVLWKQNLLVCMRRPQKSFWTLPQPQKYPSRAQKRKKESEINLKLKVRIEGTIENQSFQLHE